jgi:hypothetical protein
LKCPGRATRRPGTGCRTAAAYYLIADVKVTDDSDVAGTIPYLKKGS